MGIFSIITTYAQVGVNTKAPFGWFHVDAMGDTGGTQATPTNDSDDIIITSDGRMGIGTAAPSSGVKLDINGKVRIRGGNPQIGKVLTSSNDGTASWEEAGFSHFEAIPDKSITLPIETTGVAVMTGYSITFPDYGTYSVTMGVRLTLGGATGKVNFALMQLMPKNIESTWSNIGAADRFTGSYEIYGTPARPNDGANNCSDWRFYLSENITVTATTGLTAYVGLRISGSFNLIASLGNAGYIKIDFGHLPTSCINCSGGSFVKIN